MREKSIGRIFFRTEMGLAVKDVRFPTWGAALSCVIQFDYPREGFVNDALMLVMGSPWLNTKMVVAVSPDTNLDDPADVYYAIATRCDPARDLVVVPHTRAARPTTPPRSRYRRSRSGAPWESSASTPPSSRATTRRTSSAATPGTGAK